MPSATLIYVYTDGLLVRSHGRSASLGPVPLISTVIDEHFWYGVEEVGFVAFTCASTMLTCPFCKPNRIVRLAVYGCDQSPDNTSPARHAIRFDDLLDLDDFVHYISQAKARVYVRRLRLEQRLAELHALQIMYIGVLSSPLEEGTEDRSVREPSISEDGKCQAYIQVSQEVSDYLCYTDISDEVFATPSPIEDMMTADVGVGPEPELEQ